jgi:hypothetical protein
MVDFENIVGVLRGLRGRTRDWIYDVFFTERRVIAAVVLHPSDFAEEYRKPDLATLVIGGYAKQREIKIRSLQLIEERRSAFEGKTADELLASNRMNLEMDYENIASVEIKKGLLGTSLEFLVQIPPGKKIGFSLDRTQIGEAEVLVKKTLPTKVK